MKAVCWYGQNDMRVESVPDPKILNPRDAIIKVTSTAICGSDLHMYDGFIPGMKAGDIVGHEFMGEVVEVGREMAGLKVGDRVVVPFTISCGRCWFCEHQRWALCDNSNPNASLLETMYGHSPAGMFGYSHLFGGYAGGQAEYVRVPFADVGPLVIPDDIPDDRVLFLTDILPTGYQAAEIADIKPGDVVAVWGCGPVGLMTMRSAAMLGAERVIGIDRFPERLRMAERFGRAETINYEETPALEALKMMTGGRGPDVCIDAVGLEAHGTGPDAVLDKAEQITRMVSDRSHVLRECILACRKGGTVSIPGVYGGVVDKMPMGAAFNKALNFRMGQTDVQRYLRPLLDLIRAGELDPSYIITHRFPLEQAPQAYKTFKEKRDGCIKVVLKPQ